MNLSQKLFQILGSLVLLLWGAILIYFYHSGRIVEENYLVRFFPVAALVGGIVLLVLGLFNILTLNYKVEDCGSCCDDHDHDHGAKGHAGHDHDHSHEKHTHDHRHADHEEDEHSHHHEQDTPLGILVTLLILACPITYAAAYAPKDYTLESIERKGLYSQNYEAGLSESVPSALRDLANESKENPPTKSPDGTGDATASTGDGNEANSETKYYEPYGLDDIKESVGVTPEGALQLGVVEIFYTAGDREMQTILDGQLVEFSAQTIPEKNNNPAGTRLRVMELYVQCCLADARPFSIPIEFGKPTPEYREMGWYKVTGKITYRTEDGKKTPIVQVTRFEETDEPKKGNMYY